VHHQKSMLLAARSGTVSQLKHLVGTPTWHKYCKLVCTVRAAAPGNLVWQVLPETMSRGAGVARNNVKLCGCRSAGLFCFCCTP